MDSRDVYDAILRAIDADPRRQLVASRFDDAAFGNFVISFEEDKRPRSVVNDRGELVLCTGLNGSGGCTTVLSCLPGADEEAVLRALGASEE